MLLLDCIKFNYHYTYVDEKAFKYSRIIYITLLIEVLNSLNL